MQGWRKQLSPSLVYLFEVRAYKPPGPMVRDNLALSVSHYTCKKDQPQVTPLPMASERVTAAGNNKIGSGLLLSNMEL